MNVEVVFINGLSEVYVKQSIRYEEGIDIVYKSNKALYCLN